VDTGTFRPDAVRQLPGVAQTRAARSLGTVTTDVPARMDRLPWARWHGLILDGLEVTIVGALADR
jgi:hypothetical protein